MFTDFLVSSLLLKNQACYNADHGFGVTVHREDVVRKNLHRLLMLVLAGSAAHVVASWESLVSNKDNNPSTNGEFFWSGDTSTSDLTQELEKLAEDKQELAAKNEVLIQEKKKYWEQIKCLENALEREKQEKLQVLQRLAAVEVKEESTQRQFVEEQQRNDKLRSKNEEYREEVEDLKQTIERQQKELNEREKKKKMMWQTLNFMESTTNSLQALPGILGDIATTLHKIEINLSGESLGKTARTSDSSTSTGACQYQDSAQNSTPNAAGFPTAFCPC